MSTSQRRQILQLSGILTKIGNVRQVNKSNIQQSFVIEFYDYFQIQEIKFYCKNDLCNLLPDLIRKSVTVYFAMAGKKTRAENYNNDFEVINILTT